MKKVLSISLCCILACSICTAQEKEKKNLLQVLKGKNKQEKVDSKTGIKSANDTTAANADSLNVIIANLNDTVSEYQATIKRDSIAIQERTDSIRTLKDSIAALNTRLVEKENQLTTVSEDLDFADLCMMALAYKRCLEPYNEVNVNKALGYFRRIHKQETKEKYDALYNALNDYKFSYAEIHRIIDAAQNDRDRTHNPFADTQYRTKYINQLKSTLYYHKYIERKAEYTIEYLDSIINKALERLSRHTGDSPADFSDLL